MALQQTHLPAIYVLSSEDINRLRERAFVDFLNRLLRAEGNANGIPQANIQTSLRINEPDEGIDASVEDAPSGSTWIPEGLSVWQFKEGDAGPAEIRREFEKPGVQEAVQEGGSYIFVIGTDPPGKRPAYRRKAIGECFAAKGLENRGRLYTASHIAEWASEHPSLAFLPYFERPIHTNIMRWEIWSRQRRFSQPFHSDDQRNAIQTELLHHLTGTGDLLHLRIEGLAGVGKTRLALEICRAPGLQERVLYAETPGDVPAGLFHWMENQMEATLVIVVDECNRTDAARLGRQVERCGGRVRLLTIGIAQEISNAFSQPGFFLLDKLDDEAMRSLLRTAFPNQPSELLEYAIRLSSGYVKLASAIAGSVERNPGLVSVQELVSSPDVNLVLNELLVPDEVDRRVMQGIALFNRLGWGEELAVEGQSVADFLHLDWRDAQVRAARLAREGFLARQGRYLYVTPHLLAIWLATQLWEALGGETANVLIGLSDWRTHRAFLERLRELGDEPSARQLCEQLLAPDGIFHVLEDLNDAGRAEILQILADAHPEAGLRALERIIGHLPRDELFELQQGRRQVVWTLEKLARLPDMFFHAARLLLQLAEAENEDIMNNATGVWLSLFGTRLGGTAVPAVERHALIREALQHPSVDRKLLAVKATERAIQVIEMGMPLTNIASRMPIPQWHPGNREEDQAARLSALTILDEALQDTDPAVQEAARGALLNTIRALVRTGLADAVLERWHQVPTETDAQKHQVRDLVESILEHDEPFLNDTQTERFSILRDELLGDSFQERLRRWVGEWTFADGPVPRARREEFDRPDPQEMAASLAEEASENPDLIWPELDWLASDGAKNVFFFARRLGELDEAHVFWTAIEEQVRQGRGQLLASAYLRGQADAGRTDWRDSVLDDWSTESEMGRPLLDAIWRSEPDDQDARRLITVIQNGRLDAAELNLLVYGGRTKYFSGEVFEELLKAIVNTGSEGGARATLSLLRQRLDFEPDDWQRLEPVAWKVLDAGIPPHSDTMGSHEWVALASSYVGRDPLRITRIFLEHFETEDTVLIKDDELTEILHEAARQAPEVVWREVVDHLETRGNYRLQIYLRGWFAGLFPADVILAWAAERVPERPRIVAELTPVESETLSELARQLLAMYGEDERVSSSLHSNFVTGPSGVAVWSGNESAWLQPKLETARGWLNDPEQNVRAWGANVVQSLEDRIRQAERLEEEELF